MLDEELKQLADLFIITLLRKRFDNSLTEKEFNDLHDSLLEQIEEMVDFDY